MNEDYERIRVEGVSWIRAAGLVALNWQDRLHVSRKADQSYVTDADHRVQAMLLGEIARRYPGDAVISEETQAAPQEHATVQAARRCWVVDPIDGTRSYARGFPGFAVAVALLEEGRPVVAWIYNPVSAQMYSASAGGGAWQDGRRLGAGGIEPRDEVLIGIPSGLRGAPASPAVHRWLDRHVVRNLGSTALHLALLASGALDAVFADECRLWDIAAGELLVREAGAKLVSPQGAPYFPMDLAAYRNQRTPFIAAGPAVLPMLLADYAEALAH